MWVGFIWMNLKAHSGCTTEQLSFHFSYKFDAWRAGRSNRQDSTVS